MRILLLSLIINTNNPGRRLKPKPATKEVENTNTLTLKGNTKPATTDPNPHTITFTDLDTLSILGPHAPKSRLTLHHIEALLHAEFLAPSPRTDLLLTLKRVNFLRALHANIDVLGYSAAEMHDDALSQFGTAGPVKPRVRDFSLLPPALQPSSIQKEIPHHPWLDLLPIVRMRENLILAGESYDDVRLCRDLCGYGTQIQSQNQRQSQSLNQGSGETGVIIWRDPWDPEGWEVTESFLRRWGWVVAGCWDLFRATDRWRAVRGEPPLFRIGSE